MEFDNSWLSLVNRALALMSRHHIDSFDSVENEEVTRTVMELLPLALRKVLSERVWVGTTKKLTISRGTDGYFAVPSDYLYIVPALSDNVFFVDRILARGFRYKEDDYCEAGGIDYVKDTATITYVFMPSTDEDIIAVPAYVQDLVAQYLAYLLYPSLGTDDGGQSVMAQNYLSNLDRYRKLVGSEEDTVVQSTQWWSDYR